MQRSLIQRIASQARRTFSAGLPPPPSEVAALTLLLDRVTKRDLNFDEALVSDHHRCLPDEEEEATYVNIYQDSCFSLGVFVLAAGRGVSIPLHDHPGMYGLIRVIHGCAFVNSYDNVTSDDGLVKLAVNNVRSQLTEDSGTAVLDPVSGNIHAISHDGAPLAFLDILAPPYHRVNRPCSYFIKSSDGKTLDVVEESFYCNESKYLGPVIDPSLFHT